MVRAITDIDNELIVSAHLPQSSKRNAVKYFSALAAACLLLICGVVLYFNRNSSKPEIGFGDPVVSTQQSKIATYDLWQTPQTVITVPINIVSERELDITAVDGTVSVYSANSNEQIYEGQSCEIKDAVNVEWTIEDPDTNKTYKIKINKETVIMLRYDQTTEKWTVTEAEE